MAALKRTSNFRKRRRSVLEEDDVPEYPGGSSTGLTLELGELNLGTSLVEPRSPRRRRTTAGASLDISDDDEEATGGDRNGGADVESRFDADAEFGFSQSQGSCPMDMTAFSPERGSGLAPVAEEPEAVRPQPVVADTPQLARLPSLSAEVNTTCILVYGLVFAVPLKKLLGRPQPVEGALQSVRRTRSGRVFFGESDDVHRYWMNKWLRANGVKRPERLSFAKREKKLRALKVEVGEWGDTTHGEHGTYIALYTHSYTFHDPKAWDWRLCAKVEAMTKAKALGKLTAFCAEFGLTAAAPAWHTVGYRW
ncbi:uncharacterized protein AMSG_09376 [Thecamonas trahens ATCC 50062]|uniref:Uncharacterized protein n=1 Tax=Thecamonas trahens ATCC 50062 TaxID=461836 RepID=A0A0L0DM30_THETB|nr:hypothetical protein AMSG_09376 [Thecamonas trahens ATCC 50062]KNC53076.1 hypothetical protein AMSG_09376 [Thecamonas trahens ATCC 50062]|eukprot:XP_013754750.1 hypothetical protein AMSG_09376 [Thecamonas trahens ATCC 50062]